MYIGNVKFENAYHYKMYFKIYSMKFIIPRP